MHVQKGYAARGFQNKRGKAGSRKACFSTGRRSLSTWHFFGAVHVTRGTKMIYSPLKSSKVEKINTGLATAGVATEEKQTWLQLNPRFPPAELTFWSLQEQQEATDYPPPPSGIIASTFIMIKASIITQFPYCWFTFPLLWHKLVIEWKNVEAIIWCVCKLGEKKLASDLYC